MARKFFKKARSFARRAGRKAYRSASKAQPSLLTAAMYGAGYGAARPFLANFARSIPDIPMLGNYNDEVKLGLAGFLAAKYGSGIVRNAGRTALIVESASATAQLTSGMTSQASTNQFSI